MLLLVTLWYSLWSEAGSCYITTFILYFTLVRKLTTKLIKSIFLTSVNFSQGQRNFIKVFHDDSNTALITKIALKYVLDVFGSKKIFIEEYQFKGLSFILDIFSNFYLKNNSLVKL